MLLLLSWNFAYRIYGPFFLAFFQNIWLSIQYVLLQHFPHMTCFKNKWYSASNVIQRKGLICSSFKTYSFHKVAQLSKCKKSFSKTLKLKARIWPIKNWHFDSWKKNCTLQLNKTEASSDFKRHQKVSLSCL